MPRISQHLLHLTLSTCSSVPLRSWAQYRRTLDSITAGAGSLAAFAEGYKYFGFNREVRGGGGGGEVGGGAAARLCEVRGGLLCRACRRSLVTNQGAWPLVLI